jgi:hypothetical protein
MGTTYDHVPLEGTQGRMTAVEFIAENGGGGGREAEEGEVK